MSAKFLHLPELMNKSINNTLDNGRNSDIAIMIKKPITSNNERHKLSQQGNVVFYEITAYFTDVAGNQITQDDFTLILDVEKINDKIF